MSKLMSKCFSAFKFTALVLSSTLCFNLNADVPSINVTEFKLNYSNPTGTATAKMFKVNETDYSVNPQFKVELKTPDLILKTPTKQFTLSNLPKNILEWKKIDLEKIDLESNAQLIALHLKNLSYTSGDDKKGAITSLKLRCEGSKKDMLTSSLDLCLNQKLYLSLPSIDGSKLGNIVLAVEKNKLVFSLKSGVTIKGTGAIFYNNAKLIRIRVDKAKAGALNVIKRVFKEFKKLESDMIKVNRPWVEIALP